MATTQRAVSTTSPAQRAPVGVDVGGTTTTAVRFEAGAHAVAAVAAAPTPQGADAIVDIVGRLVADVADGAAAEPIGVGMPGRVDVTNGIVSLAVNLGITAPVEVAAMLADRLGRAVHVENDVNAAALGAFAHLRRPPSSSLAYVNVGTGIAAGYVLRGSPVARRDGGCRRDRPCPDAPWWPGVPLRAGRVRRGDRLRPRRPGRPARQGGRPRRRGVGCTTMCDGTGCRRRGRRRRHDSTAGHVPGELQDVLAARAEASPMLAALALADRVAVAPVDVPLGNLGASLAADHHQAVS